MPQATPPSPDSSLPGPVFLSVVVPAYNEVARIASTLDAMRAYLSAQPYTWEIIVSADGTDGTRQAAAAWAASIGPAGEDRLTVIGSDQRLGKGRGVRQGILKARGRIIGFIDADYKTPIEELDKLLPALGKDCDLAIGSRKVGDSRIEVRQPLYRRAGSAAFHAVMGMLLGLSDIADTQCGFKFFTADAARMIFTRQKIDGYMFDVEILRLARLLGYRIREIGVRWRDDGDSRYAPVSGTIKNARELLRIRLLRYANLPPRR